MIQLQPRDLRFRLQGAHLRRERRDGTAERGDLVARQQQMLRRRRRHVRRQVAPQTRDSTADAREGARDLLAQTVGLEMGLQIAKGAGPGAAGKAVILPTLVLEVLAARATAVDHPLEVLSGP